MPIDSPPDGGLCFANPARIEDNEFQTIKATENRRRPHEANERSHLPKNRDRTYNFQDPFKEWLQPKLTKVRKDTQDLNWVRIRSEHRIPNKHAVKDCTHFDLCYTARIIAQRT